MKKYIYKLKNTHPVFIVVHFFWIILAVGVLYPPGYEAQAQRFIRNPELRDTSTFEAKCIGVADGDTITVLLDTLQIKVRFAHVDCPEKRQPYGDIAKKFTAEKVFGKTVKIEHRNSWSGNRLLSNVYIGNEYLNSTLVEKGLAWHYKQFSKSVEFSRAENRARNDKVGLWADKSPIPPWEFRK